MAGSKKYDTKNSRELTARYIAIRLGHDPRALELVAKLVAKLARRSPFSRRRIHLK